MFRRVLPLSLGLVTSLVIAWINAKLDQWLSLNIAGFFFFIVPFGAIVLGFFGSSGYLMGLSAVEDDPSVIDMVCIIILGLFTFFLSYWFPYTHFVPRSYRGDVPFFVFIKFVIEHMEPGIFVKYKHYEQHFHPDVELGAFGYAVLGLQLIGFCLAPVGIAIQWAKDRTA